MKKYISVILLFLLTFLLTAGGLMLPSAVFFYQNQKIQSDVNSYSIEQTQFYYSSGVLDTINLIANPYISVDFSEENASCTAEEVYESAMIMLETLNTHGLDYGFSLYDVKNINAHSERVSLKVTDSSFYNSSYNENIYDNRIEPSAIPLTSAVIWNVVIVFEDETIISINIDDQSKKMVSFQLLYSNLYANHIVDFDFPSEFFLSFLNDYYNMDTNNEYQIISNGQISDYLEFSFLLSDSFNKTANLIVDITYDQILFNT